MRDILNISWGSLKEIRRLEGQFNLTLSEMLCEGERLLKVMRYRS
jgi:hypothetical protein